jgi:hypothetical protein
MLENIQKNIQWNNQIQSLKPTYSANFDPSNPSEFNPSLSVARTGPGGCQLHGSPAARDTPNLKRPHNSNTCDLCKMKHTYIYNIYIHTVTYIFWRLHYHIVIIVTSIFWRLHWPTNYFPTINRSWALPHDTTDVGRLPATCLQLYPLCCGHLSTLLAVESGYK